MTNPNQKHSNDVDNSLPSYKLKSLYPTKKFNDFKFEFPFHFDPFFQPGLYAIVNTQTNKCYLGEAGNLAERLSKHFIQLNFQKHDCIELQKDWEFYGKHAFDFVILEIGAAKWSDRIKRLKVERQYIQRYQENIYNKMSIREIQIISKISNRPNSIPISADNEIFFSISEASRFLGPILSTIRSRLNNPKYSNWFFINEERQVATNLARAVVVDDKIYLSVSMAGAAKGVSEKTVRKYIKVKSNWNYLDKLTDKQKK